ncbi:MAG: Holliday junction branch migration protein RuvA [Spirochaetaceae bacterium]|jgi:Holliday junction DNA helicase RuvA|nr:Holliday junction branch migration protein RuvA [Spirochaetaceae bacterium]
MFNSIRGIITEKTEDMLRVETGGLEWDISVPATDLGALPPPGEEGRVFTWLYHKEDQMRLFGFSGEVRRATFLELLKVEGIGPRGALKIMGGIGQEELERALETEDLARLEAVPGLGKKTAQKMLLALRGKLAFSKTIPAGASPYGDLVEALFEMGYDKRLAADALEKAGAELPRNISGAEQEQELFKRAIVLLSGGG